MIVREISGFHYRVHSWKVSKNGTERLIGQRIKCKQRDLNFLALFPVSMHRNTKTLMSPFNGRLNLCLVAGISSSFKSDYIFVADDQKHLPVTPAPFPTTPSTASALIDHRVRFQQSLHLHSPIVAIILSGSFAPLLLSIVAPALTCRPSPLISPIIASALTVIPVCVRLPSGLPKNCLLRHV